MSDSESNIQQRFESGLSSHFEPASHKTRDDNLSERMAEYRVPGVSVAMINGGTLAWAKDYGARAAVEAGAVDSETLFQAASISKTVAALKLEPFAGGQFQIAALKASVTFEVEGEGGRASALAFEQNGKELMAGRIP